MATRQEMIDVLLPTYEQMNPDRTTEDLRNYLTNLQFHLITDQYNQAIKPLDPQTEAQIERSANRAVLLREIDQKNQQKSEQHRNAARVQFADIARQLGISNCDTNFNIAYGLHPSVFNAEDIRGFISDGRLSFIPPGPDELAETELIEKNQIVDEVWNSLRGHIVRKVVGGTGPNDFDVFGQVTYGETPQQNRARQIRALLELPLETLRQLHQRAAENQAVKQGQIVDRPPTPVDPNLNSGSGLDKANGGSYVPLPHRNQHGETLDATYLVKLANRDMDLYKRLLRKHGYKNLTDRIRGIA